MLASRLFFISTVSTLVLSFVLASPLSGRLSNSLEPETRRSSPFVDERDLQELWKDLENLEDLDEISSRQQDAELLSDSPQDGEGMPDEDDEDTNERTEAQARPRSRNNGGKSSVPQSPKKGRGPRSTPNPSNRGRASSRNRRRRWRPQGRLLCRQWSRNRFSCRVVDRSGRELPSAYSNIDALIRRFQTYFYVRRFRYRSGRK